MRQQQLALNLQNSQPTPPTSHNLCYSDDRECRNETQNAGSSGNAGKS
ncbi:MAG: hypothetical protein MUE44_34095 [Oscillatoriaceae cyanobacterium Prado104]|nr:hypothetical protein [Oscillatoriaceae cyanobacterium Prado104]